MNKIPTLNDMQRSILCHALTGGGHRVVRNYYFAVDPETTAELCSLADYGLTRLLKADNVIGYQTSYSLWVVTRLGAALVGLHLPIEDYERGCFN